ncbi:MAG TPA: hypothetical protein VMO88_00270 [Acidimicrobiales bacterium]|nr:hypothetical protein [Acidimicrobiales bacterium]
MSINFKNRIFLGAAAIGVAGTMGAAAFTNSVSFSQASQTVGYGTQTVTGATATNVAYKLSADGTDITEVDVTFSGNVSTSTVQIGFNGAALTESCSAGTYTTGTPGSTAVVCGGLSQPVASTTSTNISVN